MAETNLAPPRRMGRRILVAFILALIIFLLGFVPTWMRLREQTALRLKAEHALTVVRIEKDLGSAAIDARRGQYEAARQEASAFYTAARFEIDEPKQSVLTSGQRDSLRPLLQSQDEVITLLARSDAASADRLANLYVAVRAVLGI